MRWTPWHHTANIPKHLGRRCHILDRSTLTWIVLPVLPLAAAFGLLGLVDHAETGLRPLPTAPQVPPRLPGAEHLFDVGLDLRFFNALLTYGGVALFHVAACCAVIVLLSVRLRALPDPERRAGTTVALGALALVLALGVLVRVSEFDGAVNFAYRYACEVMSSAGVAGHIMPPDCFGGNPTSRLAWMALLPYLTGLAAAAVASGLASTAFRPLAVTEPAAIEAELSDRARRVELAFQATSFVLITSMVALVAFYKLPLAVVQDPIWRDLMTGFGQGITLVWGVTFTLTLAAIFGPGGAILRSHLRDEHLRAVGPDLPQGLVPDATRKQIAHVLATLAPLLIGASGTILEQLTASL